MSRLTGSVGRWSPPPVAWKARISASHARTGASQPGKLRHLDAIAPPVEALQRGARSEEHTSELQSRVDLVCRLLLEKKKKINMTDNLLYTKNTKKQHKARTNYT